MATEAEAQVEPDSRMVTIAGEQFEIDCPYKTGHVLTADEARAINQLRIENIRNNKAKAVKEELDKAKAEEREPDLKALRKEVADYAAEYSFASARGPAKVIDPVDKKAIQLATQAVRAALHQKGTLSQYVGKTATEENKEKYREHVHKLAMTNEQIRADAKKAVAAEQKRAAAVADQIGL